MPTNNGDRRGGIWGLAAELAGQPLDRRMGMGDGGLSVDATDDAADAERFEALLEIVEAQEPLALSRLAADRHWTAIRQGYTLSELRKVPDRNLYEHILPPGRLKPSATPNKAADLCQKLTETVLVDPALPDPEPETADEADRLAAQMAKHFLRQDGGSQGTDDRRVFHRLVKGATTKSTTYAHLWVDPHGGGFVPKQVKAHPQAEDPARPLDGPSPTTDYILRYVTPDGTFTDNPAAADRVWVPKLRVDLLDRRHVRVVPPQLPVADADEVVLLHYCDVRTARRRWPETVGAMDDAELAACVAWRPPRAEDLLPPALKTRLRTPGRKKRPAPDDLFFYCIHYIRPCPDYPDGQWLVMNGAKKGVILADETLVATVRRPGGTTQDTEVEVPVALDIPLVEVTLVEDVDDEDPTGTPIIERVAGTNEASAALMSALLEQIQRAMTRASFIPAASALQARDIEESRRTGKPAVIANAADKPEYEPAPEIPGGTLNVVEWQHEQMDKVMGLSQAAQGDDKSPEVSGVARRIAVNQSLISVSSVQGAVHRAMERYWRCKLQLAMAFFTAPQMLQYVGPDGAPKQEWFTGTRFAGVSAVRIQKGSGTLLPPAEKVNFATQLRDAGFLDADEALDVVRPTFAGMLGHLDNAHRERIERQVSGWREGPPAGWEEQYAAYQEALAAYQAQQAQRQQAAAAEQQQMAVAQQQEALRLEQEQAQRKAEMARELQLLEQAQREAIEREKLRVSEADLAERHAIEREKLAAQQELEREKLAVQQAMAAEDRQLQQTLRTPPAPPAPVAKITRIERVADGSFRAVTVPATDDGTPPIVTALTKTPTGFTAVSTPTEE